MWSSGTQCQIMLVECDWWLPKNCYFSQEWGREGVLYCTSTLVREICRGDNLSKLRDSKEYSFSSVFFSQFWTAAMHNAVVWHGFSFKDFVAVQADTFETWPPVQYVEGPVLLTSSFSSLCPQNLLLFCVEWWPCLFGCFTVVWIVFPVWNCYIQKFMPECFPLITQPLSYWYLNVNTNCFNGISHQEIT